MLSIRSDPPGRCRIPIEYFFSAPDATALFAREWLPKDNASVRAVVVLVHGIGEHSGRYTHVADFLLQRSIPVIGFDLRGHGLSRGARGDTPSYAQLLDDIASRVQHARSLFPGRQVFLLGHSLGGNLVLNYVLRRMSSSPPIDPVDGVIASGPALRLALEPPAWKLFMARILIRCLPGLALSSGLETTAISRDPDVVRAYRADPLVHDRVTSRLFLGFYQAGNWALQHAAEWPIWPSSSLPALLTFGTADQLVSPSAIWQFAERTKSPAVESLPWEGFYHEVHNEPDCQLVLESYARWLGAHVRPIQTQALGA